MQDEAININDNLWSISTLYSARKVYHHMFAVQLFEKTIIFSYDIIYLSGGCEANAMTFVLPSNNHLNVEPID